MTYTHFGHLERQVPDLTHRRILDVGAGKGKFLFECVKAGVSDAKGIEFNPKNVQIANTLLTEPLVIEGAGEHLPYPDQYFGFANLSEVIEHVQNPYQVLCEVYRVLAPDGYAYVSIPSRYAFYDTHYHLYLINWLPRNWAEWILLKMGKTKNNYIFGFQRLSDMHYMTRGQFINLAKSVGFEVVDGTIAALNKRFWWGIRWAMLLCYFIVSFLFFRTFHFVLIKK